MFTNDIRAVLLVFYSTNPNNSFILLNKNQSLPFLKTKNLPFVEPIIKKFEELTNIKRSWPGGLRMDFAGIAETEEELIVNFMVLLPGKQNNIDTNHYWCPVKEIEKTKISPQELGLIKQALMRTY